MIDSYDSPDDGMSEALNRIAESEARFRELHKKVGFPPGHFYSPIPAIEDVADAAGRIFPVKGVRADLPEIDLNEGSQIELVREFVGAAPLDFSADAGWRYTPANSFYSRTDAIVFVNMLRKFQPKRFVEIGAGYSSALALDVNERFLNGTMDCTFVDPDLSALRGLLRADDERRAAFIEAPVQSVELDVFRQLEEHDVLFIDSSHVMKVGSDVASILFRILPVLRPGVLIHFHAIFYPFEYPPEWIYEGRYWNEAYFLRAYLARNRAYEIQCFSNFLSQCRDDEFGKLAESHASDGCASFWMRKLLG